MPAVRLSKALRNFRFPGQQYTAATGLNYNYQRDLEAATGRYVQSDPIGLAGGISTYGYVAGRPFSSSDPYGLQAWSAGRPLPPPMWTAPNQSPYPDEPGFGYGNQPNYGGPYVDPGRIAAGFPAYIGNLAGQINPLPGLLWSAMAKDGRSSRPKDCPTGTIPIDKAKSKYGLDTGQVHKIKKSAGAGATTWTGIDPNGDVWIGTTDGVGENHGAIENLLP